MGGAIVLPGLRSTPPTSLVPINAGNHLTRGLCAVSYPVGANVLTVTQGGLSDLFATKSGAAAITQGSVRALAASYSTVTTASWRLSASANRTDTVFERPTNAATVLAFVMRRGGNPNGNAPIFMRGAPLTAPYTAYGIVDGGGTGVFQVACSAGGVYTALNGATIPNMVPVVLVLRYDGAKLESWMGGVATSSNVACSGSLSYPNDPVTSGPSIGNFYSYTNNARSFNGDVYLTAVWDRALSDTEIRSVSANPYQVLKSPRRALWLDVVTGGVVTGTLAATDVADTASFSGTAAAPSVTGTLSATDAQDAASFTGSLIFSGSLSATESQDSAAFSGTAYAPGVSGTFAATDSADAAAFAGTAYAPGVSGTLAATDGADSAAFTGALSFVGALAAVEVQDSSTVAGAFGPSGSLAATDQKDSATFAGSHASGAAGSMAASDQSDVAVFAGVVDNGGLSIVVDHGRVLVVPRQSRALAVSAESRVLAIAPQSRALTIQGE